MTACSDPGPTQPASGPVTVPVQAQTLPPDSAAPCAALIAALPAEIDPGVRRRPVTGDATRTAAWGDPAVTLECGVPEPDGPNESADVNGVTWSVRDIGPGLRWTTLDSSVPVAVDIPDAYENGAELVNPLAQPVLGSLPRKR